MKLLFMFGLFFSFINPLISQTDTLNADNYFALIYNIKIADSIRVADSLKKRDLMIQIENLKASETIKKRELESKLNEYIRSDSLKRYNSLRIIDSLKSVTKGFPVVPFNDTLFFVYGKIGPFTAQDRAKGIKERIIKIYNDPFYKSDSLKIIESENTFDIVYGETIVLSVFEKDALWQNKTKSELAGIYLNKIKSDIEKNLEANSYKNILYRVVYVLLILLSLYILIRLNNRIFKFVNNYFDKKKSKYVGSIKIRNYDILTKERLEGGVQFVIKIAKLFFLLTLIYISSAILFGIFPATKGIADTLINYVISPVNKIINSLVKFIPNLISIIIIVFFTRYFIKFIKFIAKEIETGVLDINGFHKEWVMPTYKIVRFLVLAFAAIVIFPYLPGSNSHIFQGVTVLLGILISFGSSTAISNVVSGLVITYMRPFKIGDRVKIGDVTGDVIEKNLLVTRVRTIKNEDVTIPNSRIMSNNSVNFSSSAKSLGLIIHSTVTIGYDVPWKTVHNLLIEAAKFTKGILETPEPFVLQKSLDDFYVTYEINAFTEKSNLQAVIYSELHQNIQNKFNSSGVEIMSPHYRAERDGNPTTIPGN